VDETTDAARLLGAAGGVGATIVTLAVPLTPPLAARIVAEPAVPGAVYRPLWLIDPPPVTRDQASAG
jgi:hypothetical protein